MIRNISHKSLMIIRVAAIITVACFTIAGLSPSLAIEKNCEKGSDVDKMLCHDPSLRSADKAMSTAYFDLLRSIKDRDFRDGLIASQRRWVKERDRGVPPAVLSDDASIGEKLEAERKAMFDATRNREIFLRRRTKDGSQSAIVATMVRQKTDLLTFPGGDTQGFTAGCGFLPQGFGNGYSCEEISISAQRGNRVCTRSREWASGHITDISIVSQIKNGKQKQIAICRVGYDTSLPECPDFSKPKSWVLTKSSHNDESNILTGWNTISGSVEFMYGSILKVDPDIFYSKNDLDFLHKCIDFNDGQS